MTKKKCRKSRTSKGINGSPKKCRTSTGMKRLNNQLDAWKQGKRVVLPGKVLATDVWGTP